MARSVDLSFICESVLDLIYWEGKKIFVKLLNCC